MQKWMISANSNMYDHTAAFEKWGSIDWRQNLNYSAGDIVYIYCSSPVKKVMYKTIVEKTDLPFDQCHYDEDFWLDKDEFAKSTGGKYARLKLISMVDKHELELNELLKHGLIAAPQKGLKVSDELADYMDKYMDNTIEPANEDVEYWPPEEEYPVNITKEQWTKYIEEVEYPYHKGCMRMLKALMELGGEASCKKLSVMYGGNPSSYVGFALNIGKRAIKYFHLSSCKLEGAESFFPVAFLGRQVIEDGNKYYSYRVRDELLEALKEMDLSEIDPHYSESINNKEEVIEMEEIIPAAKGGFNKIFYGAPGCGKSYYVKKMLEDAEVSDEDVFRVTFHPEYTNTDFVGQILPSVEEKTDELTGETKEVVKYQFNPGPFTLALQRAFSTPNMVYLIIEEINRGNAAAIFGDLFQLLDREKDIASSGFSSSEYPIRNVPVQEYLVRSKEIYCTVDREQIRKGIFIPGNLTILATMNSSDQNVFTLDTAFKRRWSFEQISNDISRDDGHKYKNWFIPGTDVTWEKFLVALNDKILDYKLHNQTNEDKRLGKYFVTRDCLTETAVDISDAKDIAENFAYKVLEYVWNDVCKIGREEWFDTEKNRTLEDLIGSFINPEEDRSPLDVFQNIVF